jgi:hypothetical protein
MLRIKACGTRGASSGTNVVVVGVVSVWVAVTVLVSVVMVRIVWVIVVATVVAEAV